MQFIIDNWELITIVAGSLYSAAWAIAKKTKTKKDDEILGLIGKVARKVTNLIFPLTKPKK